MFVGRLLVSVPLVTVNSLHKIPYNTVHGQPLVPVQNQTTTKELTEDGVVPLSV